MGRTHTRKVAGAVDDVQRPASERCDTKTMTVRSKRRWRELHEPHIYSCAEIAEQLKELSFDEFDECWLPMVLDTMLFAENSPREVSRLLLVVREVYRDNR